MLLGDRKKLILKAIIDSYIDTAEPVGSRTIARKHEIGLSSATIRNEMADLEEMGLLEQPHTSAGRVPSDKGYRFYVDQLMPKIELTASEIEQIKRALKMKINELGQLISQVSAVVSDITKYTSMAITPQMNKSTLKTVQVLPVHYDKLLVIVVTNAGLVKNSLVRIAGNVSSDSLQRLSNLLNTKLTGIMLEKINLRDLKDNIEREIYINKDIIIPVMDGINDCLCQIFNSDVYLEGTTNIFNFPEFHDVLRAKQFLSVLNTKEILCALMYKSIENGGIKVRIGTENEFEEIKDCSLVTATYSINNEIIGSIGVIGPTRMEYSKVIASLNYIRKMINRELVELMGINQDEFSW
ncbi:MAG: heat-inducible transcription repressor HrcA [Firmicutes bacterium]|nr:heat-inducible transcription repressor HrcA [Bacillota bacterium]